MLNSAFLSKSLIQFGAFILGQKKLFWSHWSPVGDSQGLSFLCSLQILLTWTNLWILPGAGISQHICQPQPVLQPFILGQFCVYTPKWLRSKVVTIPYRQAMVQTCCRRNTFLMPSRQMFLLCTSGYFTTSYFAFFQPVRQLPRGTLWRNTPYPRSHWSGTNVGLSPDVWAQDSVSEQEPVGAFPRLQHHVKASGWLQILPFIDKRLTSASSI